MMKKMVFHLYSGTKINISLTAEDAKLIKDNWVEATKTSIENGGVICDIIDEDTCAIPLKNVQAIEILSEDSISEKYTATMQKMMETLIKQMKEENRGEEWRGDEENEN